jgi:hypothetical protein
VFVGTLSVNVPVAEPPAAIGELSERVNVHPVGRLGDGLMLGVKAKFTLFVIVIVLLLAPHWTVPQLIVIGAPFV